MTDITPTATPPLSRGSSFQRMLELEKKYRLVRLQSDQEEPETSPSSPTESLSPRAPLQLRRANSISQQQQDLMLKAVRRSIAPPPLSIDIPPPRSERLISEGRARPRAYEREEEPDLENVESLQKSVKFLAPDSDDDEESDQSSICHSPSWEGYGQKKKDKKKEAERKRKTKELKEQAEREAKAAKKRSSSRLSKAVPSPVGHMPTVMERSNSAPLLSSNNFRAPIRSHQMPTVEDEEEPRRPQSHQTSLVRSVTLDTTELPDSSRNGFIGGLKLQKEREAALHNAIQSQFHHANGPDTHMRMQNTHSTGPGVTTSAPVSGLSSARNDSRSSRESCPPSASRTPMLRHTSAQPPTVKSSRGRDSNKQPATSSYSAGSSPPELVQPEGSSRTRGRNEGYVRQHRDQSTERALAGLLDEQLVASNEAPSTRSSSSHTRRSSISRDVKAAALRLTGQRAAPGKRSDAREDGLADQGGDYFNYSNQPQSPLATQAQSPSGGVALSTGSKSKSNRATSSKSSQDPASSDISMTAGAGKSRSIKEVARAALHMSASQTQVPTFKTTVKPPPYYLLRAKFSSSSSVPSVHTTVVPGSQRSEPIKSTQKHPTSGSAGLPNQPGSRVSEGSSSSSNYDDGSPLPSPATTPDTSRPQSVKELTDEIGTQIQGQPLDLTDQDDTKTLRQSSEARSSGSSSDVTPRLTQYDNEGNEMLPEDRWSRTAMPMDIDFDDAQSTVSDYSDAREELSKTTSASDRTDSGANVEKEQPVNEPGDSFGQRHMTRSHTNPDMRGESLRTDDLNKQELAIPSRSKARKQHEPERPRTASTGQVLVKTAEKEVEKSNVEPRESEQRKKLRKQKPAQEVKADKVAEEDAEDIEPTTDDSKPSANRTSTNTSLMSSRFMSPIGGFIPSYGFASNPLFVDISELSKAATASEQGSVPVKITATQITFQTQAPAQKTGKEGGQATSKESSPTTGQRNSPAPEPTQATIRTISTPITTAIPKPAPPSRSTTAPVSILKPTALQPTLNPGPALPQVLSAIPKHLQPQTVASRSQALTPPEARMGPIAKMFVECCSCKFYHDMPSKLYECMAKPDAVVEDKLRGISGAITTMVKCPWCHHNMSTSCCAGYAAVVYVKEKLH